MITIEKCITGSDFTYDPYPLEKIIFFDIETTGFVADKSFLYLIGCCYYQENSWRLIQWFATSPAEEKDVLTSFIQFVKNYEVCIHFNGTTFDIPYITRKCKTFELDFCFQNLLSIDLYKIATSLKSLLHLDRCNQKSIEQALLLNRKDTCSGGDLIQVYANYVGLAKLEQLQKGNRNLKEAYKKEASAPSAETSEQLLHLLLQHNEDDLIGLQYITKLFSYQKLFDGSYAVDSLQLSPDNCICFTLELPACLPISFRVLEYGIEITGNESRCILKVPLMEGTLKYYMEDYKDYFYLPLEDTVVHKSIAASMDKNYRTRATRDNCYIKKTSLFLPQFESLFLPAFFADRKDKISFLECTDERLQDEAFLSLYTKHILNSLLSLKHKKTKDRM